LEPSYPTRCTEFLKHNTVLEASERNILNGFMNARSNGSAASPIKLKITVVGAGLGGLATAVALARKGHTVSVLEQAPELAEVRGATIMESMG